MNSSFAPNETASDIWTERSILDGLFVGAVGYGVHMTLFFTCVNLFMHKSRRDRMDYVWLAYLCALFVFAFIGNATNCKFGEMTFIDDRDFPGGPNAFWIEGSTSWVAVLSNSIYIVNSWFQDALLLYRLWCVWSGRYWILAFPSLMFLASFVLSCFLIAELAQPGNTLWAKITFNLAIPYWSISIAMNVIITLLIVGRLLLMRKRMADLLGRATATPYVSVAAMMIESASIYSINGFIFLVSYAVNSPVQNLALPLLGQTQSIAPVLIILRVAQGKAWSRQTANSVTLTNPVLGSKEQRGTLARGGSETLALASLKAKSNTDIEVNITDDVVSKV